MIEDLFWPIARDGAGTIEVGVRLRKALAALSAIYGQAMTDSRLEAADAVERALGELVSARDIDQISRLHDKLWSRVFVSS